MVSGVVGWLHSGRQWRNARVVPRVDPRVVPGGNHGESDESGSKKCEESDDFWVEKVLILGPKVVNSGSKSG